MIDIFALEHVDRSLLPELWLRHRDVGMQLQRVDTGEAALLVDGGAPSAAALVTTLLRLAAVGDAVIQASRAEPLSHLSHVVARTQDGDRALLADLAKAQHVL